MKKEMKRYFLVEYAGCRYKYCHTREEAEEKIREAKRYNARKSSSFIFGNFTIEEDNGAFLLTGHYYNILMPKSTISDIDDFTAKFTPEELLVYFQNKTRTTGGLIPDINVAYLETPSEAEYGKSVEEAKNAGETEEPPRIYVGIKYLPVMHRGDQKYMDRKYIDGCLAYYAEKKDITFFQKLANKFYAYYTANQEVGNLFNECDNVEHMEYMGFDRARLLIEGKKVVDKVIYEQSRTHGYARDENGRHIVSRRRLRDVAMFIRDYGVPEKIPTQYNGSLLHVRLEELRKARRNIVPEVQRQLKPKN